MKFQISLFFLGLIFFNLNVFADVNEIKKLVKNKNKKFNCTFKYERTFCVEKKSKNYAFVSYGQRRPLMDKSYFEELLSKNLDLKLNGEVQEITPVFDQKNIAGKLWLIGEVVGKENSIFYAIHLLKKSYLMVSFQNGEKKITKVFVESLLVDLF